MDESMLDADDDGLTNFAEQLHGGDPNKADTDGDCITDDLEVAWAQATALNDSLDDVSPTDALQLLDADGDGQDDHEVLGCDLAGVDIEPVEENNTTDNPDADNDGVLDTEDECPGTPAGVATDAKGCSSQQRTELVEDSTDNTAGDSAQSFFLTLMVLALLCRSVPTSCFATCGQNPKRSRTPSAKPPLPTLRQPPSPTMDGSNRC